MLKRTLLAASAAIMIPLATQAGWEKNNVVDPLEGVTGVGAQVIGTAEADERERLAALIVNCSRNSTTVAMTHDGFAHFSRPAMRYRLDDKPVQQAGGISVSKNHKYVGWWRGAGIPFAKSLYVAKSAKIVVLDDIGGRQTVFSFNVEGAEEGLAEVAVACKWGK